MLRFLVATLACALFASCATQQPLKELDLGSNRWSGTAVLLNYDMVNPDESISKNGCSLYVKNLTTSKEYHVALETSRHTVLFEAPAGEYEGKLLYCSSSRQWSLERFLRKGVKLVPGKINYVGRALFRFTDDGSGLTYEYGDRKEDAQGLLRNFNEMHPAWQRAVVSAYTRKPIAKSMLASKSGYKMAFSVSRVAGDQAPIDALQVKLRGCEEAELGENPAPIGVLSVRAKYDGGKLTSYETLASDHAFGDAFPKCVESAFRAFEPATKNRMEIALSY